MFGRGFAALMAFAASSAGAMAADLDLPPLSSAPPPAIGPRWEGFYLGGNIAGIWSSNQGSTTDWFNPYPSDPFIGAAGAISSNLPGSFSQSSGGIGAGGEVGYNKQFGPLVIGAATDFDLFNEDKASSNFSGNLSWPIAGWRGVGFAANYTEQLNSLGSVRAKLGYAIDNQWLIYATGGVAIGSVTTSSSMSLDNGFGFSGTRSALDAGYIIGGGVQYALGPNWSIGGEGLYYDLGARDTPAIANFTVNEGMATSPHYDTKTDINGFQLRLTAVYEFNGETSAPSADLAADPNANLPTTFGVRAGYSTGRTQMTLYDASGSERLSRLTYSNAGSAVAEPYFLLEIPGWNLFLDGYVGIAGQSGGNLQDEDFAPFTTPYSSTSSPLKDGQLDYGVVDLGYYALNTSWYQLGGLIGYTFLHDDYNAYGCTETASNPEICPSGAVQASNLSISDAYTWNAMRLGLAGTLKLPDGLTWTGSAAWLPYIDLAESDSHWLRMPGGPLGGFSGAIPGSGSGSSGYQLETALTYRIDPNLDIGGGVRYWSLAAKGNSNFGAVAIGGGPQVSTFSSQRFTAYLSTGYHF